jgi:hypothetical protein
VKKASADMTSSHAMRFCVHMEKEILNSSFGIQLLEQEELDRVNTGATATLRR